MIFEWIKIQKKLKRIDGMAYFCFCCNKIHHY